MPLHAALDDPTRLPLPGNPEQAAVGLEHWLERAADAGVPEVESFARGVVDTTTGRALLAAVFGSSPFLGECLLAEMAFSRRLLEEGPEAALAAANADLDALAEAREEEPLRRGLRIARRRTALAVALADIAGLWSLDRVTGALTDFAERALTYAVRFLLRDAAAAGHIALAHPDAPDRDSGYIVLGMGKLGARELNYSSDIDLIVLFDDAKVRYVGREDPGACFLRVTRKLVRLLEDRTPDGYVARTDLRLRPDPASTPMAVAVRAAEAYYESMGQNWERAAMIKARPVAGDRAAGAQFLRFLVPFLWRRHLDFAAVQDIHSIKRQINAHRGGATIAVAGHNLKLGRGGIREIEFFAQTQQLIWGGRDATLRMPRTLDALDALERAGRLTPEANRELHAAYGFLRRVEHRLQMVADRQTHSLPAEPRELEQMARFLGYPGLPAFETELIGHLSRVEARYGALFENAPSLGAAPGGSLVFTGPEPDPDTLETLRGMGYRDPASLWQVVSNWHRGRYRAMRSQRARELLTELTPRLLAAFAPASEPDATFMRFDAFLAALPAGVQIFSLFQANPWLLDFVAQVMGGAPRLAEHLSRHPIRLDAVLAGDFMSPLAGAPTLAADLAATLAQARDFGDALDLLRRWTHDQQFRLGVQLLRHATDGDAAGAAFSAVAETAVASLLPLVAAEFAETHGRIAGGGMVVLALGKLGGREMTVGSDLDLVTLYEVAADAEASDGAKPLPVSTYYIRLNARLVNAITAPTGEGKLYEVDMRLRPSGNKGPIAATLEGFTLYHRTEAWTWEHMALTRARPIAGDAALVERTEAAIRDLLVQPRDPDRLLADVASMRARMLKEKRPSDPWDVKQRRGGLVDCEFVAQYLQLRHAAQDRSVLSTNTTDALARLVAAGFLEADIATDLDRAMRLWRRVQSFQRLTLGEATDMANAGEAQRAALARTAGAVDFADLEEKMSALAARAHGHFVRLVEEPAARLSPATSPEQVK
ncbi:MAG: bifunctional [glutamine synthetase] adenylyltransferase/[glutamine synthetase]-adenylyl-L-tyrosine phosphorylase [Alphaproteobacteria bacterium]|nr:bifunctional [glutamine synthetase] adenylyltransferase/[glutamine synthetase]-adenylyl-L-tyrosine phosphorylase [Alphaproteobacteria bacterium]